MNFVGNINVVYTIALLFLSNCFMTIAWYGHLRFKHIPMIVAILVSWSIALLEYCFQVPANRISYGIISAYQLKIIQECLTLLVFIGFAAVFLNEQLTLRYLISFLLIFAAVVVAFYK